jgi:PAS domain S-box-containing protein
MKSFRFIFKDRSLGYKFALLSFVPIIIVTIFIALYIINSMERSMIEKTRIRAMGLVELSALSMSNTFVIYNKNLLDNFVDSLGKKKNMLYAMIVDSSDSRILAHSDHQNDGKIFTAADLSSSPSQLIVTKKQGEIYELSAPIIIGGKKYGVVRIGFSLEEVYQEIAVLKIKIIAVAIIAIILGALFSILLARIISKPVRALSEQAERIGAGNFERKVIYKSKDDLGQLADSFNRMAEELKLNVSMLKENEERFSQFMKHLPALAFMKDSEGRYVFANRAYNTILGVDPDDRIGKTDYEVWPADMAAMFRERDHRILTTGQPVETIDALTDSAGQRIIHLTSKFPILREGKPALIGGIGMDITEAKKAEAELEVLSRDLEKRVEARTSELEAAQEAMLNLVEDLNDSKDELEKKALELEEMNIKIQEATEAKSQFLANMSHELRTPLNAIIGFSEILEDQTFGELNEKQTRYINNVLVSGRHLLQLINDILDLSKVEAGKLELELSRVNIKGLLENSLIMIKEKAMKHAIKLDSHISQEVMDLEILADERKLKQIMFNILSNAAKFTPDGGSIRLEANLISDFGLPIADLDPKSKIQTPKCIEVSVADSGIGIKPEDQERVFGEFEQLDSTYARPQQGTGLGLALTRRLVGLHGGRIWVESEGEGKGSTFTFMIPTKAEERKSEIPTEREGPLPSRPDVDDSRPLVLVVEDDRQASELISQYLSEADYAVARAFDGEQAIQMARELKPYAITLDILLPKKGGWEVLAELKSFPETKDIPVVIVSIVENRPFGLNLGAIEYFVKPVNKKQLIRAVRKAVAVLDKEKITVLVVDDEPQTVQLVTDKLQAEGFNVLQAYGGQQGIDLAIQEHPDIIVLDLMMPEVSGFDVVQQLRAHSGAMEIPILIFTAKDLTEDDRQRLEGHVKMIASKSDSGKEDLLRELERLGKRKPNR